jgi:hypothetical protein
LVRFTPALELTMYGLPELQFERPENSLIDLCGWRV